MRKSLPERSGRDFLLCFSHTEENILQYSSFDCFAVHHAELPDIMERGADTESCGHEIYVYIAISLVGMVVSEHAVYDPLDSTFRVIDTYFEVVVPSEDGVDDEVFSGFVLYGFLDYIHGLLELFFVFTLEHDR